MLFCCRELSSHGWVNLSSTWCTALTAASSPCISRLVSSVIVFHSNFPRRSMFQTVSFRRSGQLDQIQSWERPARELLQPSAARQPAEINRGESDLLEDAADVRFGGRVIS